MQLNDTTPKPSFKLVKEYQQKDIPIYYDVQLKNDDYIEEGGKRLGPEGTSGAFTMDMFADSNWYNMLHKLLSFSVMPDNLIILDFTVR